MKLNLTLILSLLFISCGQDSDRTLFQIEPPVNGSNGQNGADGLNSLVRLSRGAISAAVCPSEMGVFFESGLDANKDSILQVSEVTQSVYVCDGLKGDAGPTTQYGIVEIIDPCGDTPGIYDEVLLRLATGQIIASFSDNLNGYNTRFTILQAGTYVDTDGSGCVFTVHADNTVTW